MDIEESCLLLATAFASSFWRSRLIDEQTLMSSLVSASTPRLADGMKGEGEREREREREREVQIRWDYKKSMAKKHLA